MSSSVGILISDGKKTCSKPPTSIVIIGCISQVTWDWSVIESGNSLQSGPQVGDTWANEYRISATPHVVPVKKQTSLVQFQLPGFLLGGYSPITLLVKICGASTGCLVAIGDFQIHQNPLCDFPHTASGGIETTIASLNSKGHPQLNLHIKSVYCGFTVNDPMTQPFYDLSAI